MSAEAIATAAGFVQQFAEDLNTGNSSDPGLQRLGIAGANDYAVSLDAHEADIDAIRQGLIG